MTAMEARLGWDKIFAKGSVVDLDVGLYRAHTSIKTSDLEIKDSEEVRKAISLGTFRLIPKKAFEEIAEIGGRAKRTIESHSLTFGFVKGARYVPENKMASLMEKLKALRDEYDFAAEKFILNYEAEKEAMLPILFKALSDASDDEAVVARAYERVVSEYPPAEVIRRKFYLRWTTYSIAGSKSVAAAEQAAVETENVKGIVREMIGQLREELTEKVGTIMALVARGGKVPTSSVESAKEVLDRIESMNIFGDSVLSEQVGKLRAVLTQSEREMSRSKSNNLQTLTSITKAIEGSIEEAVAEAEMNLTGVGRRKIDLGRKAVG